LQPVTPEIAAELGMKRAEGVIVTNVEPNSLASEAGFQRGDVILEVDRTPVNSLKDFTEAIRKVDKTILFLLYRNGSTFYISIKSSQKEE
jgi:serine protease Do